MAVVAAVRLSVLAVLVSLGQAAGHLLIAPTGMTALAATVLAATVLAGVLAVALAIGSRLGPGGLAPQNARVAAFRTKSWSAAFIRQRDPDAAGRNRPRAPSAAPAAA